MLIKKSQYRFFCEVLKKLPGSVAAVLYTEEVDPVFQAFFHDSVIESFALGIRNQGVLVSVQDDQGAHN